MAGKEQFCEADTAMAILESFAVCEDIPAAHSLQGGANPFEMVLVVILG